jgi:hypothetical protein
MPYQNLLVLSSAGGLYGYRRGMDGTNWIYSPLLYTIRGYT